MGKLDSRRLTLFHEALYQGYQKEMNSERDTLFKMKALWFYLGKLYPDAKKEKKAIKKATRFLEYEPAVAMLLSREPVTSAITFTQILYYLPKASTSDMRIRITRSMDGKE